MPCSIRVAGNMPSGIAVMIVATNAVCFVCILVDENSIYAFHQHDHYRCGSASFQVF